MVCEYAVAVEFGVADDTIVEGTSTKLLGVVEEKTMLLEELVLRMLLLVEGLLENDDFATE